MDRAYSKGGSTFVRSDIFAAMVIMTIMCVLMEEALYQD
jgi:hypothetical protein